MNTQIFAGAALAVTAAALILAGGNASSPAYAAKKGHCYGVNGCKGKSACRTSRNSCAGKNACKGKGFSMLSKAQCKAKGGKYGG